MKQPPYIVLIMAPIFSIGSVWLLYSNGLELGYSPVYTALLTIGGWGGALYCWYTRRKVIANRLRLDIRPNSAQIVDSPVFHQWFSTRTHFLGDPAAFNKLITEVANRPAVSKGRFMYRRESVYVRLHTGELTLTEVEADRIMEIVENHFIDPIFELVEDVDAEVNQSVSISA